MSSIRLFNASKISNNMFRTKKDVERHVTDILSKIDNENEKNLRGYAFARLYYQVKDYDSAKKHLSAFLSIRNHHAPSHKLLGDIYEATKDLENALQCYKRSLEIDPHQKDVVLKICELYCQIPVDHETARYWADRAEQLFPHHEIVFKLREYLVSAEGEPDRQELENLIATELAAQPKNVDLRIKLLRLYLDTERVKEAYDHATMIESKHMFTHSVDWYYLLGDIFEAYQEENGPDLDAPFYINYLTAMDHLIYLTLAEPHTFLENGKKTSSLNDAAAVLLIFDTLLKKADQKDIKENSWTYFLHHMKGQLYFHMTSLLVKRAKMDQGNRKEAFRFSSGLAAVCYTFKPINLLQEAWFLRMEDNQKTFTNFFQQGTLRICFIGNMLLSLCTEDKGNWLQKIKSEVCIPQVKERIYNRVFTTSLYQKNKLNSSYFITDITFEQSSLELPVEINLKEYDTSASKLCPDSLHHLVWLQLHFEKRNCSIHDNIREIFQNLQYSNKSLSKGSCESLCVLDLEAFLYASVYESKIKIEKRNEINSRKDSILCFPPHIADALCTKPQVTWWATAYGLYNCTIKEKMGEHRHILQRGLEVIRGIGNHGMEVQLVIHLARTFSNKAEALDKNAENRTETKLFRNKNKSFSDHATALHDRAIHYWNLALGMLDKLASGQIPKISQAPLFNGHGKVLSKNEIKEFQEEGKLYLAVRFMNTDKLNEAAELLSKLTSPYGSYYLALTLKKLASQESKYSSARAALLNKAKNSLLDTMDRIQNDKTHPLNKELFIELEDVENDLATELRIAGENHSDDYDETDAYDGVSFNSSPSWLDNEKSTSHSTPRPSAKFMTPRRPVKSTNQDTPPLQHFEPSPERLDAQIRALALNQDTLVKSFLQQQQTLLETNKAIVEALNKNKEAVEQLKKQLDELHLSDFKSQKPKKAAYLKQGPSEEEEDYYDPNNILDYYEDTGEDYRTSNYSYDRSSRMVHDPNAGASAPLNYVVSPALPPGPPPLNHYNYQYPPHAVLPTPPPAVDRTYYHPPPGQGLPFSEGQQLPQFHFHVASSIIKPPPPPPPTCLPQVVSALPPPPSLPPVVPPPTSLPAPTPWSKPTSVPHAFQIPLPTSVFVSAPSSIIQSTTTTLTVSTTPVTTSESQLRNLLQTPVSKTITFGEPLTTTSSASGTSPIFSSLTKTPETPQNRSRCDSENATSPDIDGHDLEREVMGDFKPLIPLPAEIVVETGEENESVLFEDRAKLYRFVDQEWKERGTGVVKILHHESSGRVRLLMRRDQVLKVCANHYLTPHMELSPLKNSDRIFTWVAQDFADEELRPEHLCIRFKTPEIAAKFKIAFEKAVQISKETESKKITSPKITTTPTTSPMSHKPFGGKFLPKAGSWTCPTCYVSNTSDKSLCIACETKKPGCHTTTVSSTSSTTVSLNSELSSFQTVTSSLNNFTFGISTASTSTFSTAVTSASTEKSVFGGFTFSTKPFIRESETPEVKEREILVVSTKTKNGPQVTKVDTSKASPFSGFSFKSPSLTMTPVSSQSTSNTVQSLSNIQKSMQDTNPAFVFSKNTSPDSKSHNLGKETGTPETLFIHVSPEGRRVSTENSSPEDFVPTAEFKPVVSLPILTDLKTGEEGEEVVFMERAKLYRFDSESKEWKERGIGELKILYMKDSKKYRILMRRDQVLKLCANHYILPDIKLAPMNNSDKAWTWFAQDYSDGELCQVQLAAKFKNSDIAQQFYNAFEKCQKDLSESSNENKRNQCTGNTTAFDKLMQPSASSWSCSKCNKTNENKASCIYCDTPQDINVSEHSNKPLSELFKPAVGSWECNSCYVRNSEQDNVCISCSAPKIGLKTTCDVKVNISSNISSVSNKNGTAEQLSNLFKPQTDSSSVSNKNGKAEPLSNLFKPQTGSWNCQSCLVCNSADLTKCAACESPKPGTLPSVSFSNLQTGLQASSDSSKFGFGQTQNLFKPQTSSSSVINKNAKTEQLSNLFKPQTGSSSVSNKNGKAEQLSNLFKPQTGSSISNKNGKAEPLSNLFKPQPGSWNCESCLICNSAELTKCAACESPKPGTLPSVSFSNLQTGSQASSDSPKFGFGQTQNKNSSEFVFGVKATPQPTTFSFGLSELSNKITETVGFKPMLSNLSNAPAVFGGATQKSEISQNSSNEGTSQATEKSQSSSIFGGSSLSIFGNSQKSTSPLFGGGTKSDSSVSVTPTLGETTKPDSSISITPIFGTNTQKFEPSTTTTSIFGSIRPESSTKPIFGFGSSAPKFESSTTTSSITERTNTKSESSITVQPVFEVTKSGSNVPLFGSFAAKSESSIPTSVIASLPSKSESLQTIPSISGSLQKTEISQSMPVSQSSVFSFGCSSQGETPVEFRFGSPQKYEFNFSGVRPRSPTKTPKSPRSPATPSDVDDDEENESFDADNIYFQPVIPLPPKVDVKTGEENEKTLFCKRAKLFRFCAGEWKERGIGDIKILHDEDGKKVRLLMRRDQVLKVCLNHYLSKDLIFEKRGDKTWQWAATDFSENEPTPELFALRFKTAEFAEEFKSAIDNALKILDNKSTTGDISKAVSSFSFKTDPSKFESPFSSGSLTSRFGTSTFETSVFGNTPPVPQASNSFFSFAQNDKSTTSTFFSQSQKDKGDSTSLANADKSKAPEASSEEDIEIIYEAKASDEDIKRAKELMLPPTFFLYENKDPCPGCIGCEDYVPPPKSPSDSTTENATENISQEKNISNTIQEKTETSLDSGPFAVKNAVSFADLISNSNSGLGSSSKKTGFEGAGTPLFANLNTSADGEGDDDTVAPAPDIHFEPVIPLPELVTVKTGEEDEAPIFTHRAKLFRFDPDKKEWKERGIGDIKILKHNEKLRFRIILRRDQVFKIACNHCISEDMELSPLSTSNNALCWNAVDYSEGQPEYSQFAVQFKHKEQLEEFKATFNRCKEMLKSAKNEPSNATENNTENVDDDNVETENESETNEDEEESESDILFEKRVTFEIADGNSNDFKSLGMGTLRIVYDDLILGYHVYVYSDDDVCLCDHVIAIQTVVMAENKKATWVAVDLNVDPPKRRKFRATFSSLDAVKEFQKIFEEGKDAAVHSEIVEKADYLHSAISDAQT